MSHKVKSITDSSAYLLPETITRWDIRVVPLKVTPETEVYLVLVERLCYD